MKGLSSILQSILLILLCAPLLLLGIGLAAHKYSDNSKKQLSEISKNTEITAQAQPLERAELQSPSSSEYAVLEIKQPLSKKSEATPLSSPPPTEKLEDIYGFSKSEEFSFPIYLESLGDANFISGGVLIEKLSGSIIEYPAAFLTDDESNILYRFEGIDTNGTRITNVSIDDFSGDELKDIKIAIGFFDYDTYDIYTGMPTLERLFCQIGNGDFSKPVGNIINGDAYVSTYALEDIAGFKKNEALSFPIELNSWGNVNFTSGTVAGIADTMGYPRAFLTDDDGAILYDFAELTSANARITDVSITDLNGDGLKDIHTVSAFLDYSANEIIKDKPARELNYYQMKDGRFFAYEPRQ